MEVRLLGPVELWGGGGRVRLGTPQQRCVLAVLAMAPGQPFATESLVARVWGHQRPRNAREALYSHMSRLRSALEQVGEKALRRNSGYLLHIDPDRVDLHRARRLAAEARTFARGQRGGADEKVAELLGEACALWRGTPLAGLTGDWVDRVREGIDQDRLVMLTEWFEAELRLGRHAAAVSELSVVRADYPLAEPLAGLLMLALFRCGRQADALEVYARTRDRLVDEIGDEPGVELRQLHARILRRDPGLEYQPAGRPVISASVAGDPGAGDPGAGDPGAGGADAEGAGAGGPAAGRVVPAQLPPDVAAFTGRAGQLRQLDAFLPSEARTPAAVTIAAIDGTAGVGKTALVVHWGHRARHRFGDGQLYVNLHGYADRPPLRPIGVLSRFLHGLGVPPDQVPAEVAEAACLYRSLLADKCMLVVLDNAASAAQVRPLLPGGGRSLVLVTSRDRLTGLVARDGAHRLPLGLLRPDESAALLADLVGAERVRAEAQAVTELAELCGQLPLALRIAAADLNVGTGRCIGAHVARLRAGDRLAALAVASDEQSTVRTEFDMSYTRLPPPARRLFRLLGLLPGASVTVPAAAALLDDTPQRAGQLLDVLAGTHLVEEAGVGRFACHALLRCYAADCFHHEDSATDRTAALTRLYEHYLRASGESGGLCHPPALCHPQGSQRNGSREGRNRLPSAVPGH